MTLSRGAKSRVADLLEVRTQVGSFVGLGFRVQGSGFRVWGLGFRVCGFGGGGLIVGV